VLQQLLGWRSLHSQARGLNSVMINQLGADIDTYTPREAEFCCNNLTGFNFGDGHMHDEHLLNSIQARCNFAPGEFIVVWVESEPIGNGRQQYWVWDCRRGHRGARQLGREGRRRGAQLASRRTDRHRRDLAQVRLHPRQPRRPGARGGSRRARRRDGNAAAGHPPMTSAVVVGSGPNGLAAALTLAAEGVDVTVLEAADTLGGGTRSSELTLPGLIHDECSAAHPLAVDTPFSRQFDLTAHGLTWRWPEVQYAHPLDDGGGAAVWRSVDETAAALPGRDGKRWKGVFGPLTERFGDITSDFMQPMLRVPSHPLLMARFGLYSGMPAGVLARRWRSTEGQALYAGVAAHAFRPFAAPMSSAIGVALGTAAHCYGWPVAEGGSSAISGAMVALLEEHGAKFETGVRVDSLDELGDADIVMLDVAPAAAAAIAGERMPRRVRRALTRYRHGPGTFKVEFAVQDGVPWAYAQSRKAGTVHVGGTLGEIAAAERMTARGKMPDQPFVLVCQQYLADPTRSDGDVHPLYAYAHVPAGYDGDATAAIEAQIERFAPGFGERVLGKHVRSTQQMAAYNANYIGGDVVTGSNGPRQLIFRPRAALDPYTTGVPGVYLCSAATPPGAGAHGMCGYNAAHSALRRIDPGDRVSEPEAKQPAHGW
jgi:phytoene dehydrogenase-like protein